MTCPHCGEDKRDHAGPCRQELGVKYADLFIEMQQKEARSALTIADLRNQHRRDELAYGHLPHYGPGHASA
jgi:hypothetical protein